MKTNVMNLSKIKPKGSIGMGAVWAMLQQNPDKSYQIWFVRATKGDHEAKGAVVMRTVRYGAPARETDISTLLGKGRGEGRTRKVSKHDAAGTIPFHYEGTDQYRSILISHLIMFDGYFVNSL